MNISKKLIHITFLTLVTHIGVAHSAPSNKWYVKSHIGLSQLANKSGSTDNVELGASSIEATIDSGFTAGIGLGYQINQRWTTEAGWEYRTNDAEVTLNNGSTFSDGNYASNVFYMNGLYMLSNKSKWKPYVGLGLSWTQEIDIDLEEKSIERSFSNSGQIGLQAMAGINRSLSENWTIQGELRYSSISDIELDEEGGSGRITGLDYNPLTVQLGLKYHF